MSEEEKNYINTLDYTKLLHKNIGNGIYLTEEQIRQLEQYQIPYQICKNVSELIYYIEKTLNLYDTEELNDILEELSEYKYYNEVNK